MVFVMLLSPVPAGKNVQSHLAVGKSHLEMAAMLMAFHTMKSLLRFRGKSKEYKESNTISRFHV